MSLNRRIVTIYHRAPLFIFTALFLLGQLLQSYLELTIYAVSLLAVLAHFRSGKMSLALVVCLLGALTFRVNVGGSADFMPGDHKNYIGEVLDEPRRRRVGEIKVILGVLHSRDRNGEILKLEPSSVHLVCTGKDLSWENESSLRKGDVIYFTATFKPVLAGLNPFSYARKLKNQGISGECRLKNVSQVIHATPGSLSVYREELIRMAEDRLLTGEKSGLFLSMTLGVRDKLSSHTEEIFKKSGLAHLLVVSGYQISILFYSVRALLTAFLTRVPRLYLYVSLRTLISCMSLLVCLVFSLLVGFEASVARAFTAVSLFVLAGLLERSSSILNTLLFSFLALHLFSPLCIFEPGVQLTFAALIGLGLASKSSVRWYSALLGSVYASVFTSIVSYIWFSQFSWIGLLLNPIFAGFISAFSCNLGFLAMILLLLGVDSEGLLLHFVAEGLLAFREFLGLLVGEV